MIISLGNVYLFYAPILLGLFLGLYFMRFSWKHYGLLFICSGIVAIGLCYLFVKLNFYSFSHIPFHKFQVPVVAMTFSFPVGVLFGVRYSPERWHWKIPFYWGIVHTGVFLELAIKEWTPIIQYNFSWDLWDSYTWWWIYFLLFEWVGGKIVPGHLRNPIDGESFRYGRWAWLILHTIVITTIFLAGYYLGRVSR